MYGRTGAYLAQNAPGRALSASQAVHGKTASLP